MKNINRIEKQLKRRFDEIFFVDTNNFTHDSFEYFFKRIADFYEYIYTTQSEFINNFSTKINLIDEQVKNEEINLGSIASEVNEILNKLRNDSEFKQIVKEGETEYKNHKSGISEVSPKESIYQATSFGLLSSDLDENITIYNAKDILSRLTDILYNLIDLKKGSIIEGMTGIARDLEEKIIICDSFIEIINTKFDFARVDSYRKIQSIWEEVYKKKPTNRLVGLEFYLIRKQLLTQHSIEGFPAKKYCDEYTFHVKRFFNAVLDWLEEQNFIEESLIDFEIWAEFVNNESFQNLFEECNKKKDRKKEIEKKFKNEFSKYLFTSYKILSIKEPSMDIKRPDLLHISRDKKILLTEAKIINGEVSDKNVEDIIKDGLKQILNYSSIHPYIDSFVVIIFNFSNSHELSFDIMSSKFSAKPFFLLPININIRPSKSKPINFTQEVLDRYLKSAK